MRKILLLFFLPVCFGFIDYNTLTDAERKFAIDHLKQTQAELMAAVQGLSDAQLHFKPAPDRWSILECVQHVTISSHDLWQRQKAALKQLNDSNWTTTLQDDMVIKMGEDRARRDTAPESFKPVHSPYKTIDETMKAFNEERNKLIDYVKTSQDDMRAHFMKTHLGVLDSYQCILAISAHTNRHMQQINEVKADPGFPKQ